MLGYFSMTWFPVFFGSGTPLTFAPINAEQPFITGNLTPGSTINIRTGTYSGAPTPNLVGTLTLDGTPVDPTDPAVTFDGEVITVDGNTLTYDGPLTSGEDIGYTIPNDATNGAVIQWVEVASNGISPDATETVSVTVVASGEMLLTLSAEDLILYDPQVLTLTGEDLLLEAV